MATRADRRRQHRKMVKVFKRRIRDAKKAEK
jgi:hypothetical protein